MHGYTNSAWKPPTSQVSRLEPSIGGAWLYRPTQALPAVYVLSRPRWQHIHLPSAAEGAPSPAQQPKRSLPLCALAAKRFSEVPVLRVGQPCSRWSHPRPPLRNPKTPCTPCSPAAVAQACQPRSEAPGWGQALVGDSWSGRAPPELGGLAGWGPGGSSGDPAASNRPHVRHDGKTCGWAEPRLGEPHRRVVACFRLCRLKLDKVATHGLLPGSRVPFHSPAQEPACRRVHCCPSPHRASRRPHCPGLPAAW